MKSSLIFLLAGLVFSAVYQGIDCKKSQDELEFMDDEGEGSGGYKKMADKRKLPIQALRVDDEDEAEGSGSGSGPVISNLPLPGPAAERTPRPAVTITTSTTTTTTTTEAPEEVEDPEEDDPEDDDPEEDDQEEYPDEDEDENPDLPLETTTTTTVRTPVESEIVAEEEDEVDDEDEGEDDIVDVTDEKIFPGPGGKTMEESEDGYDAEGEGEGTDEKAAPVDPERELPPVETPATEPTIDGNEIGSDVHIYGTKNEEPPTSFFAQPGILAAIVGGAVVGLLFAILVVMFIVYRMRKKDEGSYVLDEKRSPTSNSYSKSSREFYA